MLLIRQLGAALLGGGLIAAALSGAALAAGETRGPNGETSTPASALTLSQDDIAKVEAGHYTAALLWHTSSDFTNAVTAGATDEFSKLGIQVIATTDAAFDAAKQKNDVETVMAKKPS